MVVWTDSGARLSESHCLDDPLLPLVRRARRGDPEAFNGLVDACVGQIHRWALVQTGDSDDADDVTQDVLLRLHRGLGSYRESSRFTTWLFQVTRNAAVDLQRRQLRRHRATMRGRVAEDHASPADRLDEIHAADIANLVRVFFERLPARQREVFDLVDLQGVPAIEVSKMLKVAPATVRAHLFKARRTIRADLLAQVPDLHGEGKP